MNDPLPAQDGHPFSRLTPDRVLDALERCGGNAAQIVRQPIRGVAILRAPRRRSARSAARRPMSAGFSNPALERATEYQ